MAVWHVFPNDCGRNIEFAVVFIGDMVDNSNLIFLFFGVFYLLG